jgi:hypothetical protein
MCEFNNKAVIDWDCFGISFRKLFLQLKESTYYNCSMPRKDVNLLLFLRSQFII